MEKTHSFNTVNPKQSFPELERNILEFWQKEKIFEQSVDRRKGGKKFVFFDGPPFANGMPHYGHILASALKDAVTRYWSMKGYYVPRVNGWDCHGLPVEYEIEKELKLSGRKDIEKMGVEKFNDACRESVFRYTRDWHVLLKRIARWVDFDHEYATLENNYMESIWWVFSQIWKKGLVYEGYKPMHICPRCETSLSNFEVTQGYKDVADTSVTVKFELEEESGTYFLAWTTTPWSLLSVTGLAIGADFDYAKVRLVDGSFCYCAKNRVDVIFNGIEGFEIVEVVKGKTLVGKKYNHVFDYYNDSPEIKASKNAFRTIATDYVSVDDGTGIVTINGAYGEIDFEAAQKNGLPIFVNANMDGTYTKEVGEYAGIFVKDAEAKICQELKENGFLFKKESITHSYPHCWRCDSPLLSYATRAWFIKVTDIKDKLIKNNKKIKWTPEHIQDGRFGKWLEGARDWNISRNRFWGCPIPVWRCQCGNTKAVSSVKDLHENSLEKTQLFVVRHGEAQSNVSGIINSDITKEFHLTDDGIAQARSIGKKLKDKKIDVVISSPFIRTRETANEISQHIGNLEITFDERLVEHNHGSYDGTDLKEFIATVKDNQVWYDTVFGDGESFRHVEKRVEKVINDISKKYPGKRVLIVTHGNVIRAIKRYIERCSVDATREFRAKHGEVYEYSLGALPIRGSELDLHKPYIDNIEITCDKCDGKMKRISEVLDCWFESGAMPYAQLHYPFDNKEDFEDNFPAHFIAEGLDQTRGWFYTLHVIGTILFNQPAQKNIIVNGILLAADGEKLSKRKKNYPDPTNLFETHGVDTTRLFLYNSTAPIAEDVRFSEKHVEELVKKFTLTLWNTYSFFTTYANIDGFTPSENLKNALATNKAYPTNSTNKLDQWILSELNVLIKKVTEEMDIYNLTKATRPFLDFADSLSNWYVRRSRRRFWKSENDGDKTHAYETLYTVLVTVTKLLAPFMPFISDEIFKNLTGETSVHFADWPICHEKRINEPLNRDIGAVRTIVSSALALRSKNTIKVRQPLETLTVALPKKIQQSVIKEYEDVILEEINVKKLEFATDMSRWKLLVSPDARKIGPRFGKETQELIKLCKAGDCIINENGTVSVPKSGPVKFKLNADEVSIGYLSTDGNAGTDVISQNGIVASLSTEISEELKLEGIARDIIRAIQDLRKQADYAIADRIVISIKGNEQVVKAVTSFAEMIKRETLSREIQEAGDFNYDKESTIELDDCTAIVGVRKP